MKKTIKILFGFVLGIFFLWLIFRNTDWPEVLSAARAADPAWLLISLCFVVLSLFVRIKRWSYVVRTAGPVSFRHMYNATQIGFLANFTLPLRAGEAIRALALNRLTAIPFSRCLAFVALDRVLDLFGLLTMMIGAALAWHPSEIILPPEISVPAWAAPLLDPDMIRAAALGAVLVLAGILAVFVLLYLNQKLALQITRAVFGVFSQTLAEKLTGMLSHFAEGLQIFRSATQMAKAVAWSLATWCVFAASYMSCMTAFGIDYPWWSPFVMLSVVAVIMSAPGAPGFIGQFHFGVILAVYLIAPEVEPNNAKAIAIVAHLINMVPITIAGLISLYMENLNLVELKEESEAAETELENMESGPGETDHPDA
jgi:glycosyltransferase 2 family protein